MSLHRSAIYRGTVRHRRKDPVQHAFTYDVGMLYLDLAELDAGLLDDVPPCGRRPGRAVPAPSPGGTSSATPPCRWTRPSATSSPHGSASGPTARSAS